MTWRRKPADRMPWIARSLYRNRCLTDRKIFRRQYSVMPARGPISQRNEPPAERGWLTKRHILACTAAASRPRAMGVCSTWPERALSCAAFEGSEIYDENQSYISMRPWFRGCCCHRLRTIRAPATRFGAGNGSEAPSARLGATNSSIRNKKNGTAQGCRDLAGRGR